MWILVIIILGASVSADRFCPENHFFNTETDRCQECSVCPENVFISRTCSETNDTLCRKIDFSFMIENDENSVKENTVTPYVVSLDEDQLYWRNLAFALIIVLSLTVVISTGCVLVACYRFRHTGRFCKSMVQDHGKNLFKS